MVDQEAQKTIGILQPLVGIGDMVWFEPLIRGIAHETSSNQKSTSTSSAHRLYLIAKPSSAAKSLFHDRSYQIFDLNRNMRGEKGGHDGFKGFLRLIEDLKQLELDQIDILHHSWRYGLAAFLAGIPVRRGYGKGLQKIFLTDNKILRQSAFKTHTLDKIKDFTALHKLEVTPPYPCLTVAKNYKTLPSIEEKSAPISIILGIGASEANRIWPVENFAMVILKLLANEKAVSFLLVGGSEDEKIANNIYNLLPEEAQIHCQKIIAQPLEHVMVLMQRSFCYIGNDTSLLNLSAALDRPTIGLFAATPPLSHDPRIIPLMPTQHHLSSMTDIAFDDVIKTFNGLMERL